MRQQRVRNVAALLVAIGTVFGASACAAGPELPTEPDVSTSSQPATTDTSAPQDNYAQLQLHPSTTRDGWLRDDYANGFGNVWQPESDTASICGVVDGVVMLNESSSSQSSIVVRGVCLDTHEELYRIENAECSHEQSVGDAVAIRTVIGPLTKLLLVEVASGDATQLLESEDVIAPFGAVYEFNDSVLLQVTHAHSSAAVYSIDKSGELQWQQQFDSGNWDCTLLDGGPTGVSEEARLGCSSFPDDYAIVDATTGEFEVAPGESPVPGQPRWARDGFSVSINSSSVELFDLTGTRIDEVSGIDGYHRPKSPHDVLLPIDEFVDAYGVAALSREGSVVSYYASASSDHTFISTGTVVERKSDLGEVLVTGAGNAVLYIENSDSTLYSSSGEMIGDGPQLEAHTWTVLDGLIVITKAGRAEIHFPR
ncbi:hypothetical protein EG850_05390 [Gulosibacter macacae]|uniref:Uncharacterized protein n=1 Tax=Gulosibacter macacae TaxID=2488791 RepID=A0A3P3VYV2_9MICO|nr:hypothetical protein [Gulosibacter macacae]RRJ87248.1 hypothetical protein EG850_05390 [Gulosibacter macacae]